MKTKQAVLLLFIKLKHLPPVDTYRAHGVALCDWQGVSQLITPYNNDTGTGFHYCRSGSEQRRVLYPNAHWFTAP